MNLLYMKFKKNIKNNWHMLIVLFTYVFSFYFVYHRGQDLNWDLLNYHFYTGFAISTGRLFEDATPANLQSFFNPSVNSLAYFSLKFLPFPFSAWFLCFFQSLSLIVLAFIVRLLVKVETLQGKIQYTLTYLICVFTPMWWSELGTTFFSSTLGFLILLSVYFSIVYIQCESTIKSSWLLIFSGIFMGLAVGLKLTSGPFGVAVAFGLLFCSALNIKIRFLNFILYGFGGVIGSSVAFWWHLNMFKLWGSPLFPLYNNIFKSPYFGFTSARDTRWMFHSFHEFYEFLVSSFYLSGKTSEVPFADPKLLMFSVLGFVALVAFFDRIKKILCSSNNRGESFLLLTLIFGIVLWAGTLAYQRYLIPFDILLGIGITTLVSIMINNHRGRNISLMLILLICMLFMKVPDWGHRKIAIGDTNPFGIVYNSMAFKSPARYLLVGTPISYLAPYFHEGSYFYGLNTNNKLPEVEKIALNRFFHEHQELSSRVVFSSEMLPNIKAFLISQNVISDDFGLLCDSITTAISKYSVCELTNKNLNLPQR